MKPLVVAFGGNALIRPHQLGDFREQLRNVTLACKELAALAKQGTPLVIAHGNGPQVGNLELQMQAASPRIPTMPLDVEVGMTQGQIGHLIYLGMKKWLPTQDISVVLTHIAVDSNDPGFRHPTKPIGPWYKTDQHLKREHIPFIHDSKKGFRRVVASPIPKKILEMETIEALLEKNHIVVACGGGGIPVIPKNNAWRGVEAVIDKDFASQLLANSLQSKEMAILTNESQAYLNYRSPKPAPLHSLSVKKAQQYVKQGQFGEGSMLPKIQASIRFIQKGGKTAYIGKTGELQQVLNHEKGTRLRK
jgi:carbamate kinase